MSLTATNKYLLSFETFCNNFSFEFLSSHRSWRSSEWIQVGSCHLASQSPQNAYKRSTSGNVSSLRDKSEAESQLENLHRYEILNGTCARRPCICTCSSISYWLFTYIHKSRRIVLYIISVSLSVFSFSHRIYLR